MRNMNLAPQPRDLTALLNTGQPTTVNTEKTKHRKRGIMGEDQREHATRDQAQAQDLRCGA